MKQRRTGMLPIFAAALTLIVCGCASTVRFTVPTGVRSIAIAAGSFYFNPNHITVPATGAYRLVVTNKAGIHHNITVKDPAGKIIASQNLAPGKTVEVPVDFPQPGKYPFYCNVDAHAELGMSGRFDVATSGGQ